MLGDQVPIELHASAVMTGESVKRKLALRLGLEWFRILLVQPNKNELRYLENEQTVKDSGIPIGM